jgi:hypothetical protein
MAERNPVNADPPLLMKTESPAAQSSLRRKGRIRIDSHQYAQRVHACQPSDCSMQIDLNGDYIAR